MDLIKHISEWTHLYTLYQSNTHSDWISFLFSGRCFTPKMLNKKAKITCNTIYSKWKFWNLFVLPSVFVTFCLCYLLFVIPFVHVTFCLCYILSVFSFWLCYLLTMLPFVYVTFCRLLTETWRTEFYRWILWWRHLAMPKLSSTIIPVDLENI